MHFANFSPLTIEWTANTIPAVKPQAAFYEGYGSAGWEALEYAAACARDQGMMVILDAKRNDIGSTAEAYAQAHIGQVELCSGELTSGLDFDALTVNPYLGGDGVKPFVETAKNHGKGVYVLCKTSNPSAGDLQDRVVELEDWQVELMDRLDGIELEREIEALPAEEREAARARFSWMESDPIVRAPNYVLMATHIDRWESDVVGESGYSSVGAVVGATYPLEAAIVRAIAPHALMLVPGYGAQGGKATGVVPAFGEDGHGAIVNNSRGLIFAYQRDPWKSRHSPAEFYQATRDAAVDMKTAITCALHDAGKGEW